MSKLIEITKLNVGYENKPNVLKDVSLTIYNDDFLGVIGPNGGGKTTLLRSILGLIRPESGAITFYEKEQPASSINIGYLPQINQIDRKFPISVSEVILSGLTLQKQLFRRYSAEDKQKVKDFILEHGMKSFLLHHDELDLNDFGHEKIEVLKRVMQKYDGDIATIDFGDVD